MKACSLTPRSQQKVPRLTERAYQPILDGSALPKTVTPSAGQRLATNPDILTNILSHIRYDKPVLVACMRTSPTLYDIAGPLVYERIPLAGKGSLLGPFKGIDLRDRGATKRKGKKLRLKKELLQFVKEVELGGHRECQKVNLKAALKQLPERCTLRVRQEGLKHDRIPPSQWESRLCHPTAVLCPYRDDCRLYDDLRPTSVILHLRNPFPSFYDRNQAVLSRLGGQFSVEVVVPADHFIGRTYGEMPVKDTIFTQLRLTAAASLNFTVCDVKTIRLILTPPVSIHWRYPGWKPLKEIRQLFMRGRGATHSSVYLMLSKEHYIRGDDMYTEVPTKVRFVLNKKKGAVEAAVVSEVWICNKAQGELEGILEGVTRSA